MVTDPAQLREAVETTLRSVAEEGVRTEAVVAAGLRGRKGNQEFLVKLSLDAESGIDALSRRVLALCTALFESSGGDL